MMDFSFSNTLIKDYFEGGNSYVPSSELLYLHEHPLVTGTFLHEIEFLVLKTYELLKSKNIKGTPIDKFIGLTKTLGEQLPILTIDNSPTILEVLRKVYILCRDLLKQYNVK
jgi:hypothetical protein